jgi:hypothetical protein
MQVCIPNKKLYIDHYSLLFHYQTSQRMRMKVLTRIQVWVPVSQSFTSNTSNRGTHCRYLLDMYYHFLWPNFYLKYWRREELTGQNYPSEQPFTGSISHNWKRSICFGKTKCSKWFNSIEGLANPAMYLVQYISIDTPQNILQK